MCVAGCVVCTCGVVVRFSSSYKQHTTPTITVHEKKGRALKVQRNGGGGACFPYHYDNPGRPNKRRLTCLIYLVPEWWVAAVFGFGLGFVGGYKEGHMEEGMHNLLRSRTASETRKCRREGDGGELVLLPFLGAEPRFIPPLMDRMVIFRYVFCFCF